MLDRTVFRLQTSCLAMSMGCARLNSGPFQSIICSIRKSVTVHSALVTHHSAVLMEGGMIEVKQGHDLLDEVDGERFIWFCEYVYRIISHIRRQFV